MNGSDRVVAIDLFSGAGGMSLGAKEAGVEVLYAIEKCRFAATTYQKNFPETTVLVSDIAQMRDLPMRPKRTKTIVFGGPPCQGFSTSNQRTRNHWNRDNWMFKEFLRVALLWNPDWIIIENVKGIRETSKGMFLASIVKSLNCVGFTVSVKTLNSVHYGVPQKRERTFIVGSRWGELFHDPVREQTETITVGEALDGLPVLTSGANIDELPYAGSPTNPFAKNIRRYLQSVTGNLVTKNSPQVLARYGHVPQGGNWQDIPPSLMTNYKDVSGCHTGIYRRLSPNKPSVVIGNFRKNMLIHPYQDRGLSIREAARIQSIPDSFEFSGSIGFQQQQVGNMVPPLLAKAVFSRVCST